MAEHAFDDTLLAGLVELRHDLHRHPELLYETHRTASIVAERLRTMGCDEVVEGIGGPSVVAAIRGRGPGRSVGLRADMDALPIHEQTNLPYASGISGKMHACGHDGHVTMLLGAAECLARKRDFDGTVVLVFQPAEEGGAGAKAMIDDGLFDRFPIDEIYAIHNRPGTPVGHFAITPGAAMGSVDEVKIEINGKGGHAAMPHQATDPLVAAAAMIQSIQSVVSRNLDPIGAAVVSLTTIRGGDAFNVIPSTVTLGGTVRTLDEGLRDTIEARLGEIVSHIAAAHGMEAECDYIRHYPVTVNHAAETAHAAAAASACVGQDKVDPHLPPTLGGEDFAFYLNDRPGAIIWSGNGESAGLHHPAYDFNDDGIAFGMGYFLELAKARLRA